MDKPVYEIPVTPPGEGIAAWSPTEVEAIESPLNELLGDIAGPADNKASYMPQPRVSPTGRRAAEGARPSHRPPLCRHVLWPRSLTPAVARPIEISLRALDTVLALNASDLHITVGGAADHSR